MESMWHNACTFASLRMLCAHLLPKSKHIGLVWLLLPIWVGRYFGWQSKCPSWLFANELGQTVLWEIRLPRVLLAFV